MDSKENNVDEMTDQNDQDKDAVAANAHVNVPNQQQQTADILKLVDVCFVEIFDYLSREDLLAVGKTCKRLHNVASYCYNRNYSTFEHSVIKEEEHFAGLICKIRITPGTLRKFLDSKCKYRRLNQIYFVNIEFTRNHLERLKEVFSKIEVLRFRLCTINGCFHETLLAHCTKLKRLCVDDYIFRGNQWLHQKYPTLERFEVVTRYYESNIPSEYVVSFLKRNPNIRKFATESNFLLKSKRLVMEENIELDDLAVLIFSRSKEKRFTPFRLLNQLHQHGIYKRLKWYDLSSPFDQRMANQLVSLGGLVQLNITSYRSSMSLPVLENLEELFIYNPRQISNLVALASGLTNIQRISLWIASVNDISPFISRSAKLEKIRIFNISGSAVIDLPALNALREKLDEASNLTVYVEEKHYLATKWAMNCLIK